MFIKRDDRLPAMAGGIGKNECGDARSPPTPNSNGGHRYTSRPIDENARLNFEFLETAPAEEFEKYMGEWIAVAAGKIVAHGKDPEQVHEEGWNAGKGVPHMEYIYASPEEVPWLYVPPE